MRVKSKSAVLRPCLGFDVLLQRGNISVTELAEFGHTLGRQHTLSQNLGEGGSVQNDGRLREIRCYACGLGICAVAHDALMSEVKVGSVLYQLGICHEMRIENRMQRAVRGGRRRERCLAVQGESQQTPRLRAVFPTYRHEILGKDRAAPPDEDRYVLVSI